jgi:PAS domain S-box-containing protein
VYRIRRVDGGTSDVNIASVPVAYGGRAAMVSLLMDVSESERLKRELARSESHFRTITDDSPWALVVVRGEEIAYASRKVAAVLGRPDTHDVTGTMLFEYLDNASRSRLRRARDRVLCGDVGEVDVDLGILRADGPSVSMLAVISPIEWDGQAAYRVTIRPHRSTD